MTLGPVSGNFDKFFDPGRSVALKALPAPEVLRLDFHEFCAVSAALAACRDGKCKQADNLVNPAGPFTDSAGPAPANPPGPPPARLSAAESP